MKLPVEAALFVLSFVGRQTLGQVLVANRRLGGIVNRHRKTLNLPEVIRKRTSHCNLRFKGHRIQKALRKRSLLRVITLLLLDSGTSEALYALEVPCIPGRRYAPATAHRLVGLGASLRFV